jgi:hypothetical protein
MQAKACSYIFNQCFIKPVKPRWHRCPHLCSEQVENLFHQAFLIREALDPLDRGKVLYERHD